jgi:cell division protein FtsW
MLFGDTTFGARRALIAGSYQPGELAELAIVLYMAAWMSSKTTRLNSFFYGMIPFAMLVGGMCLLLLLQPDLSTAFLIFTSTTVMFFLAGANLRHLLIAGIAAAVLGVIMAQSLPYAQERVESFRAGISDLTRANYHVQQAIVAFRNGGWTGVGLGEGSQKFGFLPAPHTDSIFAVIGEELGLVGAGFIVLLYVAFGIRGFITARRAIDPFGALLAAGVTVWVIIQALLNIAVMTAVVPATGVPLPFISYGGSSLVVMMTGVGLLLSIHRVAVRQQSAPERRNHAPYDSSRRDGGARVPGAGGGRTSG